MSEEHNLPEDRTYLPNQDSPEQSQIIETDLASLAESVEPAKKGFFRTIGKSTVQAGQAIVKGGHTVGKQMLKTPKRLGGVIDFINKNPQLKKLSKNIKALDFLLPVLDRVDIVKAKDEVADLKRLFPDKAPKNIADRIIREKAIIAAGSGFTSASIPGAAAVLFAGDLAANIALQAEMIYQIAACYDLDLGSEERKGEALTIFGLSFCGNYATKTGLRAIMNNIQPSVRLSAPVAMLF
jgi:hypothetical protein